MPNCGTTGLIPDCLEYQHSTWKITYNVPVAGGVRYKYPNEDWKLVEGGVRYTTEINDFAETRNVNITNGQCVDYDRTPTAVYISGTALNGQGQYVFYEDGKYVYSSRICFELIRASVSWNPHNGQTFYYASVNGSYNTIGWLTGTRIRIVWFPGCNFKVFDNNNKVIFERGDSVCPTAEIVGCHYDPKNKKKIEIRPERVEFNRPRQGLVVSNYLLETDGRKGTKVEAVAYPFPEFGSRTILDLYSPKGCSLHPKICWECDACQGKKCPPNTCFKCCDGNRICCYGNDGTVLGYADKECEECDC